MQYTILGGNQQKKKEKKEKLSAYQVLKRANKGRAQTSLVQVFGITQVNDFVNKLQSDK